MHPCTSRTRVRWFALAVLAVAGLTTFGLSRADLAGAHAADGHPARIQKGPCSALGAVAYSLNGVGATVFPDGSPVPMTGPAGPDTAENVDLSVTTIDAKLADIVAGGNALTLYESDEDMSTPTACGDIGGTMVGDDLAIKIAPTSAEYSDVAVAILHADGDQTTVSIALIEGEAAEGTPAAS
jgi:hypothetical protein